jgi:hypothetical protein
MAVIGKNRIMIYGPKTDGTYIVEFKTTKGEALAIAVPRGETAMLKYFQERMPMDCSCLTKNWTTSTTKRRARAQSDVERWRDASASRNQCP